MLQHLKCWSMASLSNNFEFPRNFQRTTTFCILLRTTFDRAPNILLISTTSSLDHHDDVHDNVHLYDLVAWVLFVRLPPLWLVLFYLLRILFARLSNHGQLISTANTLIDLWSTKPSCWLYRKSVLRTQEHPSMLQCLLTRTTV